MRQLDWDASAKALAAALQRSAVTKLDLSSCCIGDEGAKALAAALPRSRLTALDLNHNKIGGPGIGDEGAKALVDGARGSSVTHIV
jgi:hypothetical protein